MWTFVLPDMDCPFKSFVSIALLMLQRSPDTHLSCTDAGLGPTVLEQPGQPEQGMATEEWIKRAILNGKVCLAKLALQLVHNPPHTCSCTTATLWLPCRCMMSFLHECASCYL